MNQISEWPEEKLTLLERRHAYGSIDTYIFKAEHPVIFEAGQYGHLRIANVPIDTKSVREFSFASAPHDSEIWFGIDSRSNSPYQQALKKLQPGDTASLFKIKGHMHWPPTAVSDVVMIAGGVGVTPFRSQLRDFVEKSIPISPTLIQVASGDFLYGEEFKRMPIEYVPIRRGELSDRIRRVSQEHMQATYYIAGSSLFVRSVTEMLFAFGIHQVESDEFKGLLESE